MINVGIRVFMDLREFGGGRNKICLRVGGWKGFSEGFLEVMIFMLSFEGEYLGVKRIFRVERIV